MASPGHAEPSIKQHGHIRLSNVSSPIWCQVIILTNDDFLFIGHLVAKFSEQHYKDQHCLGHPAALPVPYCSCRSSCGGHRVILCPFAGGFNINRCQCIHNIPIRINRLWTSLHVSKQLICDIWLTTQIKQSKQTSDYVPISILHFPARSYASWINQSHGNHKKPLAGANRDRYFGQEPLESDMVIQGDICQVTLDISGGLIESQWGSRKYPQ